MKLSFFGPKMAVSWRICVFQKKVCWNPYFYSVFWVRAFWAKFVKKGKFWTPTQKRIKFSLITEKLIFEYFLFFLVFFSFFVFFCFFCFVFFWCFFWRVEGSCEVARRATSLGPKPSLFVFLFLFCFFFLCFFLVFFCWEGLRVRWGGPKGHLTWP